MMKIDYFSPEMAHSEHGRFFDEEEAYEEYDEEGNLIPFADDEQQLSESSELQTVRELVRAKKDATESESDYLTKLQQEEVDILREQLEWEAEEAKQHSEWKEVEKKRLLDEELRKQREGQERAWREECDAQRKRQEQDIRDQQQQFVEQQKRLLDQQQQLELQRQVIC